MMDALGSAERGDVVLLHGCCHNPTGADLDDAQWAEVVRVVAERGLLPFVDIAYQGLGRGLEEDARGLHSAARRVRRGHRRAQLRQEFRAVPRPRRVAVDQDRERGDEQASRSTMCCRSRARCGRCRPIMAPPRCASCSRTRPDRRLEGRAWRDARAALRASGRRSPPPTRGWPISPSSIGMFSMLPLDLDAGPRAARRITRSTWPTAGASTCSAWPTPRSTASSPRLSRR